MKLFSWDGLVLWGFCHPFINLSWLHFYLYSSVLFKLPLQPSMALAVFLHLTHPTSAILRGFHLINLFCFTSSSSFSPEPSNPYPLDFLKTRGHRGSHNALRIFFEGHKEQIIFEIKTSFQLMLHFYLVLIFPMLIFPIEEKKQEGEIIEYWGLPKKK